MVLLMGTQSLPSGAAQVAQLETLSVSLGPGDTAGRSQAGGAG